MSDQRSLDEQLRELQSVANERGMHDAADYLEGLQEAVRREREACAMVADMLPGRIWYEIAAAIRARTDNS